MFVFAFLCAYVSVCAHAGLFMYVCVRACLGAFALWSLGLPCRACADGGRDRRGFAAGAAALGGDACVADDGDYGAGGGGGGGDSDSDGAFRGDRSGVLQVRACLGGRGPALLRPGSSLPRCTHLSEGCARRRIHAAPLAAAAAQAESRRLSAMIERESNEIRRLTTCDAAATAEVPVARVLSVFPGSTVLAVRAPLGTVLEVPGECAQGGRTIVFVCVLVCVFAWPRVRV